MPTPLLVAVTYSDVRSRTYSLNPKCFDVQRLYATHSCIHWSLCYKMLYYTAVYILSRPPLFYQYVVMQNNNAFEAMCMLVTACTRDSVVYKY